MIALVVTVPGPEAELASDALWSLGVVAVEERAVRGAATLELWTSLGDEVGPVASAVDAALAGRWSWRFEEVDASVGETWRLHARPVRVDDGLVVRPAWCAEDGLAGGPAGSGATVIDIEPGSTFGLGDHPTTILSLRAMRRQLAPGATVLDVGCGSGVLAVTAAVLGAGRADGIDISPEAVPVTLHNAHRNGVADRVSASTTPLAALAEAPASPAYDVVVANILAPVLIELAPHLRGMVAATGALVVSGVLADRHEHVLSALAPFELVAREELDGWAVLTLRPPSGPTS